MLERFIFPIRVEKGFNITYWKSPDRVIRPTHLRVDVHERGVAIIKQLYVDNQIQIIGEIDGYDYSNDLVSELQSKFLAEHGLTGKSFEEIDRYLDENELSMPDPTRIDLPTLTPHNRIQLVGTFQQPTSIAFVCLASRP